MLLSPLRAASLALGSALLVMVAACGATDSTSTQGKLSPSGALAVAKHHLDTTAGVHLEISEKDLPGDVSGLVSATGTLTKAPAFDGTVTVAMSGIQPVIPVIGVGGKDYAKLPLTVGWQAIDPSKYGVPDPGTLLSPTAGISSLLTATEGAKPQGSVRGGEGNKEVLTEYDGTLPGTAVATIVPGSTGDFTVAYTISDSGELSQAVLTGHFYGAGHAASTYTLTLSDYGTTEAIKAP